MGPDRAEKWSAAFAAFLVLAPFAMLGFRPTMVAALEFQRASSSCEVVAGEARLPAWRRLARGVASGANLEGATGPPTGGRVA
jgi:hypothetical protein